MTEETIQDRTPMSRAWPNLTLAQEIRAYELQSERTTMWELNELAALQRIAYGMATTEDINYIKGLQS